MKEEYKNFIEQFNDNSLFEKNSILDNELFGLKDYLSEEYLNNKYYVGKDKFLECKKELEKVLFKYRFLFNSYQNYEKKLKNEIKKLYN